MKKVKMIYFLCGAMAIALTSCKKKDQTVSETVEVKYTKITLKGDEYVSIPVGGTYNDPGATALDPYDNSTKDISPVPGGTADYNTPGMYPIVYEATNKYGFKSQAVRWVAVTNVSSSDNISGLYRRNTNNGPMNVVKVGTGLYYSDNVGGVPLAGSSPVAANPDFVYKTYFVVTNDTSIVVPSQPWIAGEIYCNSTKLRKSASDTTIAWIVRNSSFGTALRTFLHQ